MLTDYLFGFLALDALSTLVPIGDATFGVQHKDCVIGDVLDEETKITLALKKVSLDFFAAGHTHSRATLANGIGQRWFQPTMGSHGETFKNARECGLPVNASRRALAGRRASVGVGVDG